MNENPNTLTESWATSMAGRQRQPQASNEAVLREMAALRAYLANCTPTDVAELMTRLHDRRVARDKLRDELEAEGERHRRAKSPHDRNPGAVDAAPSDKMVALQKVLAKADDEIGVLRHELRLARNRWSPKLFREVKPLLEPATARMQAALEEIENAELLHSLLDDFVHQHSFLDVYTPRRGPLAMLAGRVRTVLAFLQGRRK